MSAKSGFVRTLVVAMCLAATAAGAQGQPRPGGGRHGDDERPRRMSPAEQRTDPAAVDSAESTDRRGRGGRMSPEERRQLRRDVHQAGRDIYPERMRGMRGTEMRGQ